MKKAALIFVMGGALYGQNVVYQQAGAISAVEGRSISVTSGPAGGAFGFIAAAPVMGARSMTGSPFTGTEERHSLQVLGDGTRIEQTESSQIARDLEGRTRTETVPGGSGAPAMVSIQDPVAGANYFLDVEHKTANKLPTPKLMPGVRTMAGSASTATLAGPVRVVNGAMAGRTSVQIADGPQIMSFQTTSAMRGPGSAPAEEDLGVQNINGVLAKGTRTTINIPAGQIGNDRAIQVVNERWFSDELGMTVKSSNADPRFGTTTYELTNVNRGAPDPSLFQVPADYTVNEGKAAFAPAMAK
ncbi:MAG TPA: hypothetical protein VG273_01905 [Bryobacteraceae bacterium]|nr:hypothetical protein [Bryobacteraceae bacterium]